MADSKNRRISFASNAFPSSSFIGFNHLASDLDFIAKHAGDNYPPHNVIKTGDQDNLVELAVAGFTKEELSVELKDQILTVSGEHVSNGREFLHRGISTKKFSRSFRLSEHVAIHGADLKDGILAIDLKYVIPEEMRPRVIPIGKTEESKNEKELLVEGYQSNDDL